MNFTQKALFDKHANYGQESSDSQQTHQPRAKSQVHHWAFSLIVTYINIGYYMCFIPFRFCYNSADRKYHIIGSGFQKIATWAFYVIFMGNAILCHGYQAVRYRSIGEQPPLLVFKLTEALIDVTYLCFFSYTFLFKIRGFSAVLDGIQERYEVEYESISSVKKTSRHLFMLIFFFVIGSFEQTYWLAHYANSPANAAVSALLSPNSTTKNDGYFTEYFARILPRLYFLAFSYARAVGESCGVVLFAFGLFLKGICEDLRRFILSGSGNSAEILDRYIYIKNVNDRINSIMDLLIISFVVGSVPFLSEGLTDISMSKPEYIVKMLYAVNGFLLCMVGSAEANNKASELKLALMQRYHCSRQKTVLNGEQDDVICMSILISELSSPDIGLKGMHFFTVTYSFLGVMLSQCIVYALIVIQLKSGQDVN